jgi:hypothetical protein
VLGEGLRNGRIRSTRAARSGAVLAASVLAAAMLYACSSSQSRRSTTSTTGPRVLLVGTFSGHAGTYRTIQSAVNAARRGDWILVAPGDYHENDDMTGPASPKVASGGFGGLYITKSGIHVRGMNRSSVIVDGTKAGATACSASPNQQTYGRAGTGGKPDGRNGIVVWKADGVSIDNLTVCNFMAGTGASGNEIWWNGGGSGKIGLQGYSGSYLTATSSYLGTERTAAQYGIFSSNASGPATWTDVYASNFNDSGMYVGACLQLCAITIDHARMEFNALGYSGTNSGGAIVIEHSEFDHNQDGLDTNTQIGADPPAPQNGACPDDAISAITHTHSCWVFMHNSVHDNNDPDVPAAGSASAGPLGTGMTIAGGRNDTVTANTFAGNGAWGVLVVPYPDSDKPSPGQTCAGSGGAQTAGLGCVFDSEGNAIVHNTFTHNGYFGNEGNVDFGQITLSAHEPRNCYAGNTFPDGSAPPDLETLQPTCGPLTSAASTGGALLGQVLCDTGFGACPPGARYPQSTDVVMHPLPNNLPSMPNPCAGVPANAWCVGGKPVRPGR